MVLSFVLYFSYGTFPTAVLGRRVVPPRIPALLPPHSRPKPSTYLP